MKACLLTAILLFFSFCGIAEEKQDDESRKEAQRLGETLRYLHFKRIPEVYLTNAGIQDVCDYLNKLNEKRKIKASFYISSHAFHKKKLDYYKNIIDSKKISVLFKDISMLELIKMVSVYFNIDYNIYPDTVRFSFGPPLFLCGGVETRYYEIPPNKFKDISALPEKLDFPDGIIAYDRKKNALFVSSECLPFHKAIYHLLIAAGCIE
jgi:hypothetical protein